VTQASGGQPAPLVSALASLSVTPLSWKQRSGRRGRTRLRCGGDLPWAGVRHAEHQRSISKQKSEGRVVAPSVVSSPLCVLCSDMADEAIVHAGCGCGAYALRPWSVIETAAAEGAASGMTDGAWPGMSDDDRARWVLCCDAPVSHPGSDR